MLVEEVEEDQVEAEEGMGLKVGLRMESTQEELVLELV